VILKWALNSSNLTRSSPSGQLSPAALGVGRSPDGDGEDVHRRLPERRSLADVGECDVLHRLAAPPSRFPALGWASSLIPGLSKAAVNDWYGKDTCDESVAVPWPLASWNVACPESP